MLRFHEIQITEGIRMGNFFTADTHFGLDSKAILIRDNRPYKDINEYTADQVRIWNEQASSDDTIYVIGDFCNCSPKNEKNFIEKDFRSGLTVSKQINAHIILIIGNNEQRVIDDYFDGSFDKFREYCMTDPSCKFDDVKLNDYVDINDEKFFLTHKPTDHVDHCLNLFGHVHRGLGVWRPYGFNVGVDLNHFRLFSEDDIVYLLGQKKKYWDIDPDINC